VGLSLPLHIKVEGKFHLITGHEGTEGEHKYNCTLSLTSALVGGEWSTLGPGRFTPGKETQYRMYRKLDVPQGRFGRAQKI
jgi:hypothetical protein